MTEGDVPPISSGTLPYARRLEEYLDAASRIFPDTPRDDLDPTPLSQSDAVESALFLECLPQKATLVQVGPLSGLCAFHFAGVPRVQRVVCTGPDQKFGEGGLGALEVARAVLAEFPDEQKKVYFQESASTEIPTTDDALSVVFLNGPHTREGIRTELGALSARDPDAFFLIPGCRGEGGPFVQAGVVDFMEANARGYRFRLLRDLTPGLASSGLGLLFPEDARERAEKALSELAGMFSGRLDPLRLLRREEELVEKANRFRDELEEKSAQLQSIKSSRSWRLLQDIGRAKKRITGSGS